MEDKGKITDYYRILRVPKGTHPDLIRHIYRELARQHPSDGRWVAAGNPEWHEQLVAAYHTLSDERRKAEYDARLGLERRIDEMLATAQHPRDGRLYNRRIRRKKRGLRRVIRRAIHYSRRVVFHTR